MTKPAHPRISTLSQEGDVRGGRRPRLLCDAVLIALFVTIPAAARAGTIVTGLGAGGIPQVGVFDSTTAQQLYSFLAYDSAFAGGVRVATGDVNADGVPDIVTGSGPGAAAHVKVFDGTTGALIRSFIAFDVSFTGGVYVAAGDFNSDGLADIVVGADSGAAPHVKVFDGATGTVIRSFFAYGVSFSGGVRVATGDVNGDGAVDIVTGTGPTGVTRSCLSPTRYDEHRHLADTRIEVPDDSGTFIGVSPRADTTLGFHTCLLRHRLTAIQRE